jgi:hypothetical protein
MVQGGDRPLAQQGCRLGRRYRYDFPSNDIQVDGLRQADDFCQQGFRAAVRVCGFTDLGMQD